MADYSSTPRTVIGSRPPVAPKPFQKTNAGSPGMPNPMGFQSQLPANGQAVNKGSILQGLRHDSKVNANTGTQTGDRAVQDMAKSQLMQNQATASRAADTTNAQFQAKQQQQQEQLTQQGRASRLQRYQQMTSQSVDQMNLANQLARQQLDLRTQWRTGLIGLLR